MAGDEFDPAEFAAFKQRSAAPSRSAPPLGDFDPAEFEAFKARSGGGAQARGPATFDERYGEGPTSARSDTSTPLGASLQRAADERLVGKPDGSTGALAALYRAGNTAALNIPRTAAAGIATGLGSGGFLGFKPRSFSENYQLAKDQEEAFARQAPKSALAGTVGGIVLGAGALPVLGGATTTLGRGAQAAGTGAFYGATAEAIDSKDAMQAATGAGIGGALGGVGSVLIEKAAPVVLGFFRSGKLPFRGQDGQLTAEAWDALRGAGVDPRAITPELEQHIVSTFVRKGPSEGAAREAVAAEQGITLSRGQATQDPRALALEQAALDAQGGRSAAIGQGFADRQAGQIDAARGRLETMAARGGPRIENPHAAFEAAADRARLTGEAVSRRAREAQGAQDDALRAVQGPMPGDTLDGATAAVSGLREAAERSRGAYRAAYDDVAAIPGTFAPGALDDIGAAVRSSLGPSIPIDAVNTPAAARALADLDNIPAILGLREGETPTLQQLEQVRKRFSNYYGATGQNPTDRRALNAIREAFDKRAEDFLAIGQFGERAPAAARVADDFPGPPAGGGAAAETPAGAIAMPELPQGAPEPMGRFIARNGGIAMTGDARAADLNRAFYPGAGTLARHDGIPLDQWRVRLVEAGYLTPDEVGGASTRDVSDLIMDAIRAERTGAGSPRYRFEDEARVGAAREAERIGDANADHLAMVDRQSRRAAIDLEGYGITGSNLDREALKEAAEAMVRGEADDAITAYDRAIGRRDALPVRRAEPSGEPPPFPELGEGVGPAASSSLPIGDTAPADAMRKARGLFRDHKQAFAPRGPGDVAGQRLQKIVERDASPNEVVSMLFGTTTGRVSSGQLQTLDRVRSAVGADSPTWGAVQQSIIGRYVGGDGRGLADRLDYLLRGEGRDLARHFLTPEQQRGLGQLRAAVAATERAQQAAPAWVAGLERHGYDPNAIASSLFGSGIPGARVGAASEARAAKGFLGEASEEWAGLRQAAVQRLTDSAMNATKVVERLRGFTDGPGAGVARELFSAEELGQLRRFSAALKTTLRPDGSVKPGSDRAIGIATKALDVLAGAVAYKVAGPGAGVAAYGARAGQRAIVGGIGSLRTRRSFEGGAPRVRGGLPAIDPRGIGTAGGIAGTSYEAVP